MAAASLNDKIPAAIVILVGIMVVAVVAGWNPYLGKFLFAFVLIFALVWLIGGGTQAHLFKWTGGIFPTPLGKAPTQIGVIQ